MSITRLGATKQYSDNWENIFGGRRSSATSKSAVAKKSAKKKSPKKSKAKAAKKPARRK
jgi:hypothetical protein